jgi:hypothetical protein
MTTIEDKTRFLLILNLCLQLLDGTISYGLLALAPAEPNLSLNAAVMGWPTIGGLFYNKALAATW